MTEKTFEQWLQEGISLGVCGPPICYPHDGLPLTEQEDKEFEDGGDPCVYILRLYEDRGVKAAVESNHSPSVWRATNSNYNL
jgi:hypothetical protein